MKKSKIQPPAFLLAGIIIQVGLHYISPVCHFIKPPYNYAGLLLIIIGLVINLQTDEIFKKINTTVKSGEAPSSFSAEGPFRYSRNPMYLGMVFIMAGIAVILGSVASFAGPLIFFMVMHFYYIPLEEKVLENSLGEKYLEYKGSVRMWI